jgi:ribose 5-phosphate isomerase B
MKVIFASDHAGFALKEQLKPFVEGLGFAIEDIGPHEFDASDDYPDYVGRLAERLSHDPHDTRGIILGGSGEGEAIVANRFSGIRAAVFYGGDIDIVRLSRDHNDANILSLGARFLSEALAKEAVKLWLETPFSEEERHRRRIQKIDSVRQV